MSRSGSSAQDDDRAVEIEGGSPRSGEDPGSTVEAAASDAGAATRLWSARRAARGGVRRDGLISRALHQGGIRVVFVQGAAGHGKSTLLEQIRVECEQRGDITGWLDVRDSDNDIRRFYEHLEAMIASMRPAAEAVKPKAPRRAGERDFRSDWLLSQLFDIGGRASLFLDDLHLLNARQSLSFLAQVLAHVPDNVQIFIASRTLPDVGLARLAVVGEALVIRSSELCFTPDETARYFAIEAKLELTAEELDLIFRQTDGWPAALQLFRLALRHPAIRGDLQRFPDYHPEELNAYLAENVLRQQTAGAREFLLLSASMSRMSGPLCDEVLRREGSEELLVQFEAAGLFVRRMDSDPRWFTYHPLFASFLLDHLRPQGGERIAVLRRRAADWFRRNGCMEDAVEHYVAAGDHAAAAEVLDEWADLLIPAAQLMTVERWSERIAAAEVERRPALLVKVAWALTFLQRHARLAPMLDSLRALKESSGPGQADPRVLLAMVAIMEDDLAKAESILERIDVMEASPSAFRAFELGAVCNVRGYAAMSSGDFAGAHALFGRSRELSEPSVASFAWAYSISSTSVALIAQGQLHEALALLRNALTDRRMYVDESISQASVVASHVMALYEADELEEAESQFLRFRDVIANAALHDYVAVAYVAMARIQDFRGQPGKALEILEEAESIGYAHRWPRVGSILTWERVRREIVRGEPARARDIAERAERIGDKIRGSWTRFSEDVQGAAMGRLRLHAYCLEADEALRMITTALGAARRKGRVHRQIKLLQFGAVAHRRRGSQSRSQQYLLEAVRLAAPGGYVRAFLDEGPLLEQLVREELLSTSASGGVAPPYPEFLRPLARRLGCEDDEAIVDGSVAPAAIASGLQPAEQFTRREMMLLKLLAGMASTQEMADAMRLSRDGLKFHLKNIYAKLAVSTRLEAIRAARSLGL